jgi:hypothetical protein
LHGKEFLVETDHRNLQWIEMSQSPIVVRWRNLLQSFNFNIRHIPGAKNLVADFFSRMNKEKMTNEVPINIMLNIMEELEKKEVRSLKEILDNVHGGRSLHFGLRHTWERAISRYPEAQITMADVRQYIDDCPVCQITRNPSKQIIQPQTRTLKKGEYRRTIGVDHFTVAKDRNENVCCIMITEHFSHFPYEYAAKSYDADTLARVLFKHYCTFGIFQEIAMDPGSANMSKVVTQLNSWLGVNPKVSLVARHESNGCEGSIREFLRHLKALVFDERAVERWSDEEYIALINFELSNYPTRETGKITPRQLKYGTEDAAFFKLPEASPPVRSAELLKQLDENLK